MTSIHIKNTNQDSEYGCELKENSLFLTERLASDSFGNHRTDALVNYIESML